MNEIMRKNITLEKIQLLRSLCVNAIDYHMMGDIVDATVRSEINHTLITFKAELFGEKCADDTIIEYPKDWYQWFKQRWFPKWLLRRYPILKIRHVIKHKIAYPKLAKDFHPLCKAYAEIVTPIYQEDGHHDE